MKKNIYITDLDHTFLQSDLSISDYTKKIWNSYAKHSIMGVATARTYLKTMQFLEGVTMNAPMILLDGALVVGADKQIIDTKFISQDMGNMIIDEGSKLGIYPFVIALEDEKTLQETFLYSSVLNKYQQEVLTRYAKDDNLVERDDIEAMEQNFKIVYMGEEELLEELHEKLALIFGDALKFILAPEAYVGCHFLTILHKDADKRHGIESIAKHLGFKFENLTVFGDNFNDIGMFELAKTAVAVANAQEGVKEKADIVLEYSNDADGVAKYLAGLDATE